MQRVTIPLEVYKRLIKAELMLAMLEQANVESWEGHSDALSGIFSGVSYASASEEIDSKHYGEFEYDK